MQLFTCLLTGYLGNILLEISAIYQDFKADLLISIK